MSSNGKCGEKCCLSFYMENGECIECPDGKFGTNCTRSCPNGYYGRLCMIKCNCSEENCNPVTGCMRNPEISSINPQQETDSSSAYTSNPNTTIVIVASIICLTIIVIAAMVIFKLKRSNGERRPTKEHKDIRQQNKTGTLNVKKTPCTHRYEDDNTYDSIRESQIMQGNITDENRLSHKKKGKNYFDSKKTSPTCRKKGNNDNKRGKRTLQNFT